ncbi:MAG: ATPase [Crocinitomicaceae bacterium]|nr:ATPase [Crocinitomicaceae bacterium]|tara:strand:+ start:6482 stop:7015 length:534 start_codon:yes stop_codon:yes gene_type:complete
MSSNISKILITGPEATGKSYLCKALAQHFNSVWNPEFARKFLAQKDAAYTQKDLDYILEQQMETENQAIDKANRFLFCDTGPEVIKIWSEHKYNSSSDLINATLNTHHYDLTLLLYPDLPWEPDPLRETPDETERLLLFHQYEELLLSLKRNFKVIKGKETHRTQAAIQHITTFFNR